MPNQTRLKLSPTSSKHLTPALILLFGFILWFVFWWITKTAAIDLTQLESLTPDNENGAYVFRAAGCSSCHMDPEDPDALVLTGGQPFSTSFGLFVAPNISMSKDHGIGSWTLANFATAVRQGVNPDGEHYYPAFPYSSYSRMTDQDVGDLWAFWQTLPATERANQTHQLMFPVSTRRGVGIWKAAFLTDDWFHKTGPKRGRYLVEALSHCGECHTPRNMLGGLRMNEWMKGGPNPTGNGFIPDIIEATQSWSEEDIVEYLSSGFTPDFDIAGGNMAKVIDNTKYLTPIDRLAIATYIKSLAD